MSMTRDQFFRALAGAGALALGLPAMACGSDDEDPPGGNGNCAANGTVVTIGTNHGHTLVVTKEEVTAAAAKTYDITGSSTHTHSITITANQFATLASTGMLTVMSTAGGAHTHTVTVVCA